MQVEQFELVFLAANFAMHIHEQMVIVVDNPFYLFSVILQIFDSLIFDFPQLKLTFFFKLSLLETLERQ